MHNEVVTLSANVIPNSVAAQFYWMRKFRKFPFYFELKSYYFVVHRHPRNQRIKHEVHKYNIDIKSKCAGSCLRDLRFSVTLNIDYV